MALFGNDRKAKEAVDPLLGLPVPADGDRSASLSFLRGFMDVVRPPSGSPEAGEARLRDTVRRLDSDPGLADALRRSVRICLRDADLLPLLTQSGLASSRSLGRELSNRIKHKMLPPLRDERDFLAVVDAVFRDPDDFRWVERIPLPVWGDFLSRLSFDADGAGRLVSWQLLRALDILSVHVAHLGCEPEVTRYLPDHMEQATNPFLEQQDEVRRFLEAGSRADRTGYAERSEHAKSALAECHRAIGYIREHTHERGASLAQTFILYRLEKLLGRMSLLLDIVDGDGRLDMERMADYFVRVVRNQNRKYSVREFLSQTTGYLAYQIAEQKGRRGNTYITKTRVEYRDMVYSAMNGGLIVCFIALVKNMIPFVRMAPFWQGMAYSLNYSLGFLLIDQTGSTLATKQPAFTANAVAGSIEEGLGGRSRMQNLVETVARVSRSQIASFFGNLVVVFPGTYLLAWAVDMLFGFRIVEAESAMRLLESQHPTKSLSLLYACNTGFFLFLSGIINGYVQNRMRYGMIADRIRRHPGLGATVPAQRLDRIAGFWDRKAGSVAGSIALGFFLGMAGLLGRFFGIPFDIRHITISAGNASIGFYGIDHTDLPFGELATIFLGILAIGFLNFLVSFSLSFYVAIRSRGLRMRQSREFLASLWAHVRRHPMDFIRAPRPDLSGNDGGKV